MTTTTTNATAHRIDKQMLADALDAFSLDPHNPLVDYAHRTIERCAYKAESAQARMLAESRNVASDASRIEHEIGMRWSPTSAEFIGNTADRVVKAYNEWRAVTDTIGEMINVLCGIVEAKNAYYGPELAIDLGRRLAMICFDRTVD